MGHYTFVSVRGDDHRFVLVRRVWRYQRANQNPYTSIEEEQTTEWPNEKVQKDKQPSTNKGNNKITELRTILQRESQNS